MQLKYQLMKMASVHNRQVRGRYAPSPSGIQHLGNIQTAVLAWLQARLQKGEFILRMDDLDTPRVKHGSHQQILDDLRWIGIDWDVLEQSNYLPDQDKVYVQSAHKQTYQAAFKVLQKRGDLYACVCSRKDIRNITQAWEKGKHSVYPGTCRNKSVKPGQKVAWRFKVPDEKVQFLDRFMGEHSQQLKEQTGDFIVKRRDQIIAYQLASVVDDINLGITDIVRGADLLDSTPGQIALFDALGAPAPRFWHTPLRLDASGRKLGKRDGSDSLQVLRGNGASAEEIIGQISYDLGLTKTKSPIDLFTLCTKLGP